MADTAETGPPGPEEASCPYGPEPTSPSDELLQQRLQLIRHRLLILSGKGGVGKSTVAVNLAVALSHAGRRVGLLDVDIHGPSIPKLLHLEGRGLVGRDDLIQPVTFGEGLKVVSIGFLLEDDRQAVIWRGPLKMRLINQFLGEVAWGELDYLIVDSPPGTGDEPLSVVQLVGRLDGAVIVTTPQELALADVRRCITFCREVKMPVLGVVENMSGLVCPHCGQLVEVFGPGGGGERMAAEMEVPVLARIPLDPQVVQACDQGKPFIDAFAETPTAEVFRGLAERVTSFVEGQASGPGT